MIATSSSDAKLELAGGLGADAVVNHATDDVVDAVKEATGVGVDIVVEHIGEATWQRSLQAGAPARSDRRLRRDDRPEPEGLAAPGLVEAADDPRLDDGHEGRLRGCLRARGDRPGKPVVDSSSRSPKLAPLTSGWNRVSSSGRSCSRSPNLSVPGRFVDEGLEERNVLALFRMPENAESETPRRILDRLDRSVVGPCGLAESCAEPAERLMMM